MSGQNFEFVVKGRLSSALIEALDGLDVTHSENGLTHLVVWAPDQAALHGRLENLRDLNIELVSLNPVPREA
jgi:hypothetical protein